MNTTNNSNNESIQIYELQLKIDEKYNQLQQKQQQLKNHNRNAINAKPKMQNSRMQWRNIIMKRSLQWQSPLKNQKSGKKNLKMVKPYVNQHGDDDLMEIINRIMILQRSLMELSQNIANYRRLQMCWIFFQCSLSIVFNAYNLVVFLLKIAYGTGKVPLKLAMLLFFYGYHIIGPLADTIQSVLAYHLVYVTLRQTATIVDEINMYIVDVTLNNRLSQFSSYVYNNLKVFTLYSLYKVNGSLLTSIISGTATYIIILIQSSDDGDICINSANMNNTQKIH